MISITYRILQDLDKIDDSPETLGKGPGCFQKGKKEKKEMSLFCKGTKPLTLSETSDLLFANFGDLSEKRRKLWLACSGGLDSMVLLSLVADYARRQGLSLELLHVNYGLRGKESEEDAVFVQEAGSRLGLNVHVLKAEPNPKGKTGVQAWAREVRYTWFEKVTAPEDKVLLAHHRDDLIETILMRIVRGSPLHGLMGMKKSEGRYLRPLLDLARSEIEAFAQSEGIVHREDSSNATLDYSRNRLRHLIIPELESMFPGARSNLLELARGGQEWTQFFQTTMDKRPLPECPSEWKDLGLQPASHLILFQLEEFLGGEVSATKPSRSWLEALYECLASGANTVLQLDERIKVTVRSGQFRFEKNTSGNNASTRWLQYQGELTKSGLASCLSPGARLDVELDDGMEMQDNENVRTSRK